MPDAENESSLHDSSRPDRDPTPVGRLTDLAHDYTSRDLILTGVDEAAHANNRLVLDALQSAWERLADKPNDVFAISLDGSRIKGYHTAESDIDIVVVKPDDSTADTSVHDILNQELRARGLKNLPDKLMEITGKAEYDIPADPENFIYTVDHHPTELITLFGNGLVSNPNFQLARLAALEIIDRYTGIPYPWHRLAERYAYVYLGHPEYLTGRLAEVYGLPLSEVRRIITPGVLRERYGKFGLKDPKTLLREHRAWYGKNRHRLNGYRMYEVYRVVMRELEDTD